MPRTNEARARVLQRRAAAIMDQIRARVDADAFQLLLNLEETINARTCALLDAAASAREVRPPACRRRGAR